MARLSVDRNLSRAKSHAKRGEFEEARKLYVAILEVFAENKRAQEGLAALNKQALSPSKNSPLQKLIDHLLGLYNQGKLEVVADQALAATKQYPDAFYIWNILGAANKGLGRIEEASKAFKKVTSINPTYADGHNNLGITLQDFGRYEEAKKSFNTALSLKPEYAEAHNNMGLVAQALGNFDEAIRSLTQALSLNPNYAEAHNNMGLVLQSLGNFDEAVKSHSYALALNSDYIEAYNNLGNALKRKGKLDEAINAYEKALSLKPDFAEARNNLGLTLQSRGDLDEAIKVFNKTLSITPDYVEAYHNIGNALKEIGKFDEARDALLKTVLLKPNYVEAHFNLGNVFKDQGRHVDAIESYENALSHNPNYSLARVQKLHQQAHICAWDAMEVDEAHYEDLGIKGESVTPFAMLAIEDAPSRHRQRSEKYIREKHPLQAKYENYRISQNADRLRIGYFSADFHNHATMYLMAQIFDEHEKSRFKVFAYSYGPDKQDEMRDRLVKAVDVFHDVRTMTDLQIVKLAREESLDIAIDLKGFTKDTRLGPFAFGLAPIQISYLGYPGTTGAHFMDYIVADPIVIPDDKRQHYSEQVIYLPNTYQPTDRKRRISEKLITRIDEGLPNDCFVFCCFNNNYKISATEFDIWMRLLTKTEGSVLWLLKSNEWSVHHLKKEAAARGVSADRLIFADSLPQAEHLARHKLADLFLDTFNYNAHTTASDALWAGLPVVTKAGEGFAARVASSLLSAIGLPELITKSEQQYEALCLDLFENPQRLSQITKKLESNRLTHPLFDSQKYTKHLESGYELAHQRYLDGKQPAVIFVPE